MWFNNIAVMGWGGWVTSSSSIIGQLPLYDYVCFSFSNGGGVTNVFILSQQVLMESSVTGEDYVFLQL